MARKFAYCPSCDHKSRDRREGRKCPKCKDLMIVYKAPKPTKSRHEGKVAA